MRDPSGDPASVRAAAARVDASVAALEAASGRLAASNQEAARVWEGSAQRVFSVLAGGWSDIIRGTSRIGGELTDALRRYASILEGCQDEARLARQRLQALIASTPAGMVPDQAAVSALVAQADNAAATATRAARELAATATRLMGDPKGRTPAGRATTDVNASFVSRAHTAQSGRVPTDPGAGFDAQADHIESQLTSVLGALSGSHPSGGARPNIIMLSSSNLHSPVFPPIMLQPGSAAPSPQLINVPIPPTLLSANLDNLSRRPAPPSPPMSPADLTDDEWNRIIEANILNNVIWKNIQNDTAADAAARSNRELERMVGRDLDGSGRSGDLPPGYGRGLGSSAIDFHL